MAYRYNRRLPNLDARVAHIASTTGESAESVRAHLLAGEERCAWCPPGAQWHRYECFNRHSTRPSGLSDRCRVCDHRYYTTTRAARRAAEKAEREAKALKAREAAERARLERERKQAEGSNFAALMDEFYRDFPAQRRAA